MVTSQDSFHKNEFIQRSCKMDGQTVKVKTVIWVIEFSFAYGAPTKFLKQQYWKFSMD